MKKLAFLFLFTIWINATAQEIRNDWRGLDPNTKLKEYIETKAYDYLNFEGSIKKGISISDSTQKILVRDISRIPNSPVVLINNDLADNEAIWKDVKLSDLKKVLLVKPSRETSAIYGSRGKHGLIIINIKRRKWKELARKYGIQNR